MAVRLLIVVSLAAVASSGCSLNLGDSPFICNTGEPQCPLGYACKSNYCVKDGKCPDHVPGCEGSTAKCGNGKCEAGEITSCPKDCTGTGDARAPDMGQVPWEQGVPPPDMMQSHDWDPWPPDKFIPSPDLKPALAGYGYKCLNGHPACEPGLDCVAVGSATTAFCTQKCTSTTGAQCPGTPPGTAAYCLLENSSTLQRHCVFLCKLDTQTWSCPGNITCSPTPNPPLSQQYPCLP